VEAPAEAAPPAEEDSEEEKKRKSDEEWEKTKTAYKESAK